MSDFFLRSKHWMLFIPIALPTLVSYIFQGMYMDQIQQFSNEMQTSGGEVDFSFPDLTQYSIYLYGYILLMLVGGLTQIGWLWTIGNDLNDRVPAGFNLKLSTFKKTIAVSTIFLVGICIALYLGFSYLAENLPGWTENGPPNDENGRTFFIGFLKIFGIAFIGGIIAFGCQVYNVVFVGKTLRSIELNKPAQGGDIAGYALLSYFLIIGIWLLQPKVNRYLETGQMEKPREGVW